MEYDKSKVVVGKKQILRSLTENNVKFIRIATDTDKDYAQTIANMARLHNVTVEYRGTMDEIAAEFGIDVPSGAVAQLKD